MGTIVYLNLMELLLEEGDKTEEELIEEAINRFGFSDRGKLSCEFKLQLLINKENYTLNNGKYKLLKLNSSPVYGRRAFLKQLQEAPEDYLKKHSDIKILKEALEARVQNAIKKNT